MANVRGKLATYVMMLSSTHDGEIVNAARAIGRQLKAEGKDWHALADYIDAFTSRAEPKRDSPGAGFKRYAARTSKPDHGQFRDMVYELASALQTGARVTEKEGNFIEDINFRFERFGLDTHISTAQGEWIEKLYERIITRRGEYGDTRSYR